MKEQTNYDYEKYVQIAQMAKMGWWESDLKIKNISALTLLLTYSALKVTASVSPNSTKEYVKTTGCVLKMNICLFLI